MTDPDEPALTDPKEQLRRYAEDFGVLASDYDALRRSFVRMSRDHEQAREMHRAFEAMVRALGNFGFVTTDAAGKICDANAAAARLLGTNADALAGADLVRLLDAAGAQAVDRELTRLAANRPGNEGFSCLPAHAAHPPLLVRAMRVPRADGPGYRLIWLLHAGEQSAARMGLHQEVFSALFSKASHAVMVTDAAGAIVSVNAAFTAITGYEEHEVLGENPRILSSGHQDKVFYDAMWTSLGNTGEWHGEIWNRRKNGEVYQEWLHITASRDAAGRVSSYVAMFYDVGFARKAHERIYHLAHYDPLTSLPNRALFNDRLSHVLAEASCEQRRFGVLFLDLDGFKEINDSLGHDAGDEVLREFARRLIATVRSTDTVARLGGDEFVLLADSVSDEAGVQALANKVFAALRQPVRVAGHNLYIATSIGAACYPEHGSDASILLRNADAAMYAAKRAGGNDLRLYSEEFNRGRLERLSLASALRQALPLEQLALVYQPQVEAESGRVTAVEALLRWHLPSVGDIPPDRFIPIAEETGLIVPIGAWVLEEACTQQAAWRRQGLPALRMAVNVSARQLNDRNFLTRVEAIIARTGIEPQALEIEVTESQLMESVGKVAETLHRLRALGVSIAVDDFGTGYSSLGRLHTLPIDRLKIDRSFVIAMDQGDNGGAIARAILAMASSLSLTTVAEGVETQAQFDRLRAWRCSEMQGYFFARPLPGRAIPEMLAALPQAPGSSL